MNEFGKSKYEDILDTLCRLFEDNYHAVIDDGVGAMMAYMDERNWDYSGAVDGDVGDSNLAIQSHFQQAWYSQMLMKSSEIQRVLSARLHEIAIG